jgi:UDP-N-acetylglucosamine--N-acetylmuramyl-(pentapeptide) pyrophosphoryl-undecaprenol N-acetylglucosamine transferase
MKKFKPDVVVSTGSYVSVPVVLAGHSLGAAVYLHEQNGFPGVSNRMLARFADKVFLGFEAAREHFYDKNKIIYSGNPVRSEFSGRNRAEDRKILGIPADDLVILVFGGSLGSETTNSVGEAIARAYAGKQGYTVIWGTGSMYYDEITDKFANEGFAPDNVRISAFINNMPELLSAADISISRSGALSTAETTMEGRAAIFIPSPNVTADHQYYNAKAVADAGGAYIVRDDDNTVNDVMNILKSLDADRSQLLQMETASRSVAPVDAADIIVNTILETYKG